MKYLLQDTTQSKTSLAKQIRIQSGIYKLETVCWFCKFTEKKFDTMTRKCYSAKWFKMIKSCKKNYYTMEKL